MATLASAVVKVGANIADFTTDMRRAAKISEDRSAQMRRAFTTASKAIGVAAVGASAAIGKMVNDQIKQADQFQKLSIRLGASTESLSELQFVAEQSGVKFNQLTMGLQRMTRRISEAASAGKGEAVPALKALGLSATELAKIPLDKQFEVVAQKLSEVEDEGERVRLGFKLFDSEGVSLLQTMTKGAAGIQELREQAHQLGLTVGGDTANAAAAFNDRMNALGKVVTGFTRHLMTEALPILHGLLDSMMSVGDGVSFAAKAAQFFANVLRTLVAGGVVLKNAFEAASKLLVAFGVTVVNTFKALISPITRFVEAVGVAFHELSEGNFKRAAQAMSGIAGKVKNDFVRAGKQIANVATDLGNEAFVDLREGLDGAIAAFEVGSDVMDYELAPSFENTAYSADGFTQSAVEAGKEASKLANEQRELANWLDNLRDKMHPAIAITDDLAEAERQLDQALVLGAISGRDHAEMLAYLRAEAEKAREGLNKAGEDIVGVAAIIENAWKRLDDTFANFWRDMLSGGKNAFDALKNFALDTLAQLIHAFTTQRLVLKLGASLGLGGASGSAMAGQGSILQALSGGGSGFKSIFSGLLGGNQIGNFFTWLGGGLGPGGMGPVNPSSLFAGAGSYSNLQYGAAGILGYFGGDALFGGQGGLGGSLGATIGMAVGGPLGALVGGLIGGAIGGMFGDRTLMGELGGSGQRTYPDNQAIQTAFGTILGLRGSGGFGDLRDPNTPGGQIGAALQQFDAAIASFLDAGQIERITEALKNWRVRLEGDALTIENVLNSRFDAILNTFSQGIQDYVRSFDGIEAQTEALQRYVTALNITTRALAEFVNSSPGRTIQQEVGSSRDQLRQMGEDLRAAFDTFDNTPESLERIALLVAQRYQGEIEYLQAIDGLIAHISASIAQQQNQIREQIGLDIAGRTAPEQAFVEAQRLFTQLGGAGSPEEIASLVQRIQNLVGTFFGALAPEQQAAQGQQLIDFLRAVEGEAIARANQLADNVILEGQLLRDQAAQFAEDQGIQLDAIQASTDAVAANIDYQTTVIQDGNAGLSDRIDRTNAKLDRVIVVLEQQADAAAARAA